MKHEPKFALVRWGREKKWGQDRLIRLARITAKAEGGGYWCQTKPGHPDAVRQVTFTAAENLYEHDAILKTWAAMPSVKEIRAELDRIAREAQIRAARTFGKMIENIRKGVYHD